MVFGISSDVLGIYNNPSLIRFRIPFDRINASPRESMTIEAQYHIFSKMIIDERELCKGPRHVETLLNNNGNQRFANGGWTIATNDGSQLSTEKIQAVFANVRGDLNKIFTSDNLTWNCQGLVAFYNDEEIHRKVRIYDLIFNR